MLVEKFTNNSCKSGMRLISHNPFARQNEPITNIPEVVERGLVMHKLHALREHSFQVATVGLADFSFALLRSDGSKQMLF